MIELIKGDITKIAADIIVNAANTSLLGGGGVDGAIHRAGGPLILEDCRKIIARQGGCKTGEAVITRAGNLPAKFVIHTVGPVWNGGKNNEEEKLLRAYHSCFNLAIEQNAKSIAFPNISTGIYRFPKDKAASIAIAAARYFMTLQTTLERILFVCFDDENFSLYQDGLNSKTL